jgi:hypothetical protein
MKNYLSLIFLFFTTASFSQTVKQYSGIIKLIDNPCLTDPCLPGLVWSLETDTADFILTINNNWIWSDNDLVINERPYYELEIIDVLSISSEIEKINLKLFPNPCRDILFIDSERPIDKIRMYSSTGQLFDEIINIKDDKLQININWLNNGIYLLEINIRGDIYNYKILKY